MNMTFTIFAFSLFVILSLLISKIFERKVRKIESLSNLFVKGDRKLNKVLDLFIFRYNRSKMIANIFIFDFIPSYIYEMLVKMKDYVAKKYYNAGDEFRGRRMLRSNGSVSFFLERLAEDRSKN